MWFHRMRTLPQFSWALVSAGLLFVTVPSAGHAADTVILPNLIVQGKECVGGADCISGETFTNGEELKLKDTVPILRFDDTDASDPDWQLEANNGTQKFSLVDKTNSKTPFSVGANAPNDSLYISPNGRVGMGTSVPLASLHLATSGTPGIVLDQTNTGYSWRMSGTDQGFFLNDGFTGFTPFGIAAGAPNNSVIVSPSGNVGLKTSSPQGNLHIFGLAGQDTFNGIGPDPTNGPGFNFGYAGSSFGRGAGFFNVRPDASATGINPALYFATVNAVRMVVTNAGRVGIGTNTPTQQLDVTGNIRASGTFISNNTTLNVPDYVFEPEYQLMPLTQLATYIEKEKHLPEIPSGQDLKAQGVDLGAMQMQLLKKVEELTLYTIAQERTITAQVQTIDQLRGALTDLTARLTALEQARAAEQPASKDTRQATQHRP